MTGLSFIVDFFRKHLYNPKWKCVVCNKEIFDEGYFCSECGSSLPYNNGRICEHCGRKVEGVETYCSTCKGVLVNLDTSRSVFNYEKPISYLIQRGKYKNNVYLYDMFAEQLSFIYFRNMFDADCLVYIPMTAKAYRKRGYNQSEILSEKLSEIVKVPVVHVLEKTKDTKRQAKLNRKQRMSNLLGAFHVVNRSQVKDKKIMIIDDVTTTGATAEVIAEKLKKAGAIKVYLLTIASVPNKNKY